MPEHEYKARRIMVDFQALCNQHGSNFKLSHPHPVRLLRIHRDGSATVRMEPRRVMDVNLPENDKHAHIGRYTTGRGLYRAFMCRLDRYDRVARWLVCVALYRRSGIPEIAEIGKSLTEEFQTVPALKLRRDDMDVPSDARTKYAMALATRAFVKGRATCPHCAGKQWEESILGWTCCGCGKSWSDHPGAEGWI